jgi:NhaP-type Na+/H+ or K+/H+ antiporter
LQVHIQDATVGEEALNEVNESTQGSHNEEEHAGDMTPLLFVIIALIIGAGTRHWLRKSPLPYTVTLLVIGLILGAMNRLGWFGEFSIGSLHLNVDFLASSLNWAGHIDPHLILFVFLPTLIFEAAYAMDVHTFKKTSANAFILAVPGIIISLVVTGAFIMMLRFHGLGLRRLGLDHGFAFRGSGECDRPCGRCLAAQGAWEPARNSAP